MHVKTLLTLLTVLMYFFLKTDIVSAQEVPDTLRIYQVETVDGNVFMGKIVSRDEHLLVLKTDNLGVLNIQFKNVKDVREIKPNNLVKGELWTENPHVSRYFYLPNGYGLEKGEGYFQNTWVLFNQVSYGFTNNFSMGVGLIPTFLFGARGAPVWITPKFTFPVRKDKWNLGTGAIIGTYVGESGGDSPLLGMVYGVSTFGTRDKNFTTGFGYAFANDEWSDVPVFSLGGTIRTGKRHYFLTENYFVFNKGESAILAWIGGRFASRNLAVDYGFIIPVGSDMDRLIAVPWLSLTVPFGNKQKGYVQGK